MTVHVLTANRLLDGAPLYLADGERWVDALANAKVLRTDDEREHHLAWARAQEALVCDPYVLDVTETTGGPVPTSARERIRAGGARPVLERLGYGEGQ
ncbi:MAG: DUF2849 domain-containing protein [Polyangiales bacterium]